jgi:hypothetical protein
MDAYKRTLAVACVSDEVALEAEEADAALSKLLVDLLKNAA